MMRQGHNNNNNNKQRMRGRNGRKGPNPLTRSFESNGPDVKIRGTALHIAEKYTQLARDAMSSGDRVAEQSYLQHAEHYYRIVAAAQAQNPQPQQIQRSDDDYGDDDFDDRGMPYADQQPMPQQVHPVQQQQRPVHQRAEQQPRVEQQPYAAEPQPYVNGAGPFNGHPAPGMLETPIRPVRAEGEFVEDEGEDGQGAPVAAGAEGEQPMYRMRRRRGRGRSRRPDGEGGAPGAEGAAAPPVPAED